MYRRQPERINERDVPESQHSIFIRGLAGHITTSEIREFFEDEFGSCSFDFIKLSKDREQLHIAVRFESKTAARECMDKYNDRELFGYPVTLTWFRDIRRYMSHIQQQGRGRRRYDYDEKRSYPRRSWRDRNTSRSGSRSEGSRRGKSVSRSPSHYSSVNSESNKEPLSENRTKTSASPEPKKNSQKRSKKDKKKRRHESLSRSRSRSNHSEKSPRVRHRVNEELGEAPMETSDDELVKAPVANSRFSISANISNLSANESTQNISSSQNQVSSIELPSTANIVKNTSFTLDLTSNNPPRQNIRKPEVTNDFPESNQRKSTSNSNQSKKVENESKKDQSKKPKASDNYEQKTETVSRPSLSSLPPVKSQVESASPTPAFNGALTNFKSIQRMILQDVRYMPSESNDNATIGNFRLSALSTEKSAEVIREEKLKRLSAELNEKVERKKLQLELSYRHDCETFGLMTRKLISKDRSLEDRFRLALLEVMKDLEAEAMKSLDDYIDQMIFLTA